MMKNFAALNLKKNQEIVVTSCGKEFHAKFNKFSLHGSQLNVIDVKDGQGKFFGAFKNFLVKDVTKIEIVGQEITEATQDDTPTPAVMLTPPQLSVITDSIANFTYIQQPDATYFKALEDISKHLVIGISADCCRGRIDNITLLSISTGDKIYIFDLLALDINKTIGELKGILNSDSHMKILYDALNIVDNFKKKFQIDLQPAFDVMLAAGQFYDEESVIGLKNVVKSVIGLDLDFADKDLAVRPLNQEFLHGFAVKTGYLIPMYQKLASKAFPLAFCQHSVDPDISSDEFFDELCLKSLKLPKSKCHETHYSVYKRK